MFSDSQAKKFVGKKSQTIFPVTKFFTDGFFFLTKFYVNFFSSDKVFAKVYVCKIRTFCDFSNLRNFLVANVS